MVLPLTHSVTDSHGQIVRDAFKYWCFGFCPHHSADGGKKCDRLWKIIAVKKGSQSVRLDAVKTTGGEENREIRQPILFLIHLVLQSYWTAQLLLVVSPHAETHPLTYHPHFPAQRLPLAQS